MMPGKLVRSAVVALSVSLVPGALLAAARGSSGTTEAPRAVGMKGKLKLLPARPIDVTHPVNGRVQSVMVKEGETVKLGQPLCTYVDSDVRRRLEMARAHFEALLTNGDDSATAQHELGEARRDLKLLEEEAESLTLFAPSSGVVGKLSVSAGQRVGKGTIALQMKSDDVKVRDAEVAVTLTDEQMQSFKGVKLQPRAIVKTDDEKIPATVKKIERDGRDVTVTIELSRVPQDHASDVKLFIEAQPR